MSGFDFKEEDFDFLVSQEDRESLLKQDEPSTAAAEHLVSALKEANMIDMAASINVILENDAFLHWVEGLGAPLSKERRKDSGEPKIPISDFAPDTAKDQGPTLDDSANEEYFFSAVRDEPPLVEEPNDGGGSPPGDDDLPPSDENSDDDDGGEQGPPMAM